MVIWLIVLILTTNGDAKEEKKTGYYFIETKGHENNQVKNDKTNNKMEKLTDDKELNGTNLDIVSGLRNITLEKHVDDYGYTPYGLISHHSHGGAQYSEPIKGCLWEHTFQIHKGVSLKQCKEKCSTASFACKSLEYIEKECWLSKDSRKTHPNSYQEPCSGEYSDVIYLEMIDPVPKLGPVEQPYPVPQPELPAAWLKPYPVPLPELPAAWLKPYPVPQLQVPAAWLKSYPVPQLQVPATWLKCWQEYIMDPAKGCRNGLTWFPPTSPGIPAKMWYDSISKKTTYLKEPVANYQSKIDYSKKNSNFNGPVVNSQSITDYSKRNYDFKGPGANYKSIIDYSKKNYDSKGPVTNSRNTFGYIR